MEAILEEHKDYGMYLQIRLKRLGKTQQYLATLFNRKPAQISNAIRTNSYPTLKNKIIKHIVLLEAK